MCIYCKHVGTKNKDQELDIKDMGNRIDACSYTDRDKRIISRVYLSRKNDPPTIIFERMAQNGYLSPVYKEKCLIHYCPMCGRLLNATKSILDIDKEVFPPELYGKEGKRLDES